MIGGDSWHTAMCGGLDGVMCGGGASARHYLVSLRFALSTLMTVVCTLQPTPVCNVQEHLMPNSTCFGFMTAMSSLVLQARLSTRLPEVLHPTRCALAQDV